MITPDGLKTILDNNTSYYSDSIREAITRENKQIVLSKNYIHKSELIDSDTGREFKGNINNSSTWANLINSLRTPVPTVEFMEDISLNMSKIFNAEDKNIAIAGDEYIDQSILDSRKKYGLEFWATSGYKFFTEHQNSMYFCHYDDNKEFYVQFVGIETVKALDFDREKNVTLCVYKEINTKKSTYHCFDQDHYTVIEHDGVYKYKQIPFGDVLKDAAFPVIKDGVCPIQFISDKLYYSTDPVQRKNYFADSVGKISQLLLLEMIRNVIDGMQIPVRIKYAHKSCDQTIDSHSYCKSGYLYCMSEGVKTIEPFLYENVIQKCPICNTDSDVGFGGTVTVDPPSDGDDVDLTTNSLIYKTLEVSSVQEVDSRISSLKNSIRDSIIGIQDKPNDNQQHNKERIKASFDLKKQVALIWKKPFERALEFTANMQLNYYAPGTNATAIANLGTDFFLNSIDSYIEMLEREKGMGINITDSERAIICTKYESNQTEKERRLKRLMLEENFKFMRNKMPDYVKECFKDGAITKKQFNTYANFDQILTNFENKYSSIYEFILIDDSELRKSFEITLNEFIDKIELNGSEKEGSNN